MSHGHTIAHGLLRLSIVPSGFVTTIGRETLSVESGHALLSHLDVSEYSLYGWYIMSVAMGETSKDIGVCKI